VGIRPGFIPHLFERFRQSDASTTREYGGLGLGLSIVKNLMELHGGTVSIESPGEGLGTTVTVHLPLTVADRPKDEAGRLHPAKPKAGTARIVDGELAGLRIMVVDDQPDARELIRRVLEDCAADVETACSVDEAIQMFQAHRPDVLVTGIGTPGADGFQLLRRVRALGPEHGGRVPAIALTAFARPEDRTRALRAGFTVHVSKPVDPSELVAVVASVARLDE
jgi:CheY-like chemotaxis protein